LQALLRRFNPASPIDFDLILAFFLTLVWGGLPGTRPAWLFTGEDNDPEGGRGVGKSSVPLMGSRLVGGAIVLDPEEKMRDITTRLLTPEALYQRVALLDNLKSLRFSWGQFEGMITGTAISGHRLYHGEAKRPNTLNFCLTLNGAALSRDMAQRCVIIQVKRPDFSGQWAEETTALIDRQRWEILGDLRAVLEQPGKQLNGFTRWGAWEQGVLSRVAEPEECQKVIEERQKAVDEDHAEGDLVREHVTQCLQDRGHNPVNEIIFIPAATMADWVNGATGERRPVNKANAYLNTLFIKELRKSKDIGKRGYRWTGTKAEPRQAVVPLKPPNKSWGNGQDETAF
jgi:hypothetical protein